MPRPPFKRRRPNNFSPGGRVNTDNNAARQELERKLAAKPVGKRPADSDDSDNLVTKTASTQARRNPPRSEIYASGAVGKGDKPGAHPTKAQRKQIMKQATDEILRERSKSTSRANSVVSNTSAPIQSPKISTISPNTPHNQTHPRTTIATSPAQQTNVSASATRKVSNTPLPENSVLGVLKPRKRQASILQLIDNNDSSPIRSEDEEEFLPDEISTPLETNLKRHAGYSRASKEQSESKKRNRDSNISTAISSTSTQERQSIHVADKKILKESKNGLDLPAPSRTQSRKLEQREAAEEDIMALPESSDSETSMSKLKPSGPKPTTRQRQPAAPSTYQLKSLMPSTRYNSARLRDRDTSFDIPADSDSSLRDSISEKDDHSAFLPRKSKRGVKTRQRQPLSKPSNARPKMPTKSGTSLKSKGKTKSTSITISTPPLMRSRKPLPLSSLRSGNIEAKSPSQKQGAHTTDKDTKNTLLAGAKTTRKRYGGSPLPISGKENQLAMQSNEEFNDGLEGEEDTVEIQVGRGHTEAQAWNKQWAEIDDFSLDFEDISASLGSSSSPLAR